MKAKLTPFIKIHLLLLLFCACFLFTGTLCAQVNTPSFITHTIEKGQSLYSIAAMYGVEQSEIIKYNPKCDEKIIAGQTLQIPVPANNETLAANGTFHTITQGETLYQLTVRYGVTAQAICRANPGLSATNFKIGQVVRIPRQETTTETGEASPAPTMNKQQTSTANIKEAVKPRCREMHKVQKKETIYTLCRMYGITEEELKQANPELNKKPLKKGMLLCIPYTHVPATNISSSGSSNDEQSNRELFRNNAKEAKRYSTIRCALILPFLDGIPDKDKARAVEYYEGFLISLDSLKHQGVNIDLYTYNEGTETASINPILNKPEMKDMHIIFGPFYQKHIKPLADFAQANSISLVVPFTGKDNTVFNNPFVYQINTPQSYLYSDVYDHFSRNFPNAKVIFVEATQGVPEKAEFIKGFKTHLSHRGVDYKLLPETPVTSQYAAAMDKNGQPTIFIPTSGSNLTLIKILPQLKLLTRENPDANVHLFGFPEWQTYTKDHLETFFEIDTYFYTSFYTNNLLPASLNFTRKYLRWYGKEMDDRYPKYGMLGFDTGYYFLKGLSKYGNLFEQELHSFNLPPVQTGFKFSRVNNWGGFVNRKVFFIHLSRDYRMERLDFD